MHVILYGMLFTLVVIFLIAFLTSLWRTMHDILSKILSWMVTSAWGLIGLGLFIWFLWHYKK